MIQRDIDHEFGNILMRLIMHEGSKLLILQKEMNNLSRVLNEIDDLVISFSELTSFDSEYD